VSAARLDALQKALPQLELELGFDH
jgi:hypothetical protein